MRDVYPEEYAGHNDYSLGILYLLSGGICFHDIAMLSYNKSPLEQSEEKHFAQGHCDDSWRNRLSQFEPFGSQGNTKLLPENAKFLRGMKFFCERNQKHRKNRNKKIKKIIYIPPPILYSFHLKMNAALVQHELPICLLCFPGAERQLKTVHLKS